MCEDRPHCVTSFWETERQRLWFQLQTELSYLESAMKQNKVKFHSDYRRRAVGRVCLLLLFGSSAWWICKDDFSLLVRTTWLNEASHSVWFAQQQQSSASGQAAPVEISDSVGRHRIGDDIQQDGSPSCVTLLNCSATQSGWCVASIPHALERSFVMMDIIVADLLRHFTGVVIYFLFSIFCS